MQHLAMSTSSAFSGSLVSATVHPSASTLNPESFGGLGFHRSVKQARADTFPPLMITAESVQFDEAACVTTFEREKSKERPFKTNSEHVHLKQVVNVPQIITKPRVILISGPTGVGKTRLSIELAKTLGGEIVNADSVQVYQGLDIGAAKAPMEERQGVPHHVMDLVLPTVDYTTEDFVVDARAATEEILSKGKVPIVIGGTGLYMRSFIHNRVGITSHRFEDECEQDDEECDAEWDWDYDFQAYFLYQHRADLFPRVDIRCEQMIPALLDETAWMISLGVRPRTNLASAAIGYEEAMDLFLEARETDGVISEERFLQFLRLFMRNSKSLVKKQIAWFRKEERSDVRKFRWIQAGQPVDKMVEAIVDEYRRPVSELSFGKNLKAVSMKEQKRLRRYKPTLRTYSDAKQVDIALERIKRNHDLLFCKGQMQSPGGSTYEVL